VGFAFPLSSGLLRTLRQAKSGLRHKKLTDWAWQLLVLVRRWHPERKIVAVADAGYASLKLLDRCRRMTNNPITFITAVCAWTPPFRSPLHPVSRGSWEDHNSRGRAIAKNLSVVAEDPSVRWSSVVVADWYGALRSVLSRWFLIPPSGTARAFTRRAPALGSDP
jgi:hypothetical protein